MSAASIYISFPDLSLFKFPADPYPEALPPPSDERSFRSPWHISRETYNYWLQPAVPLTFAVLYASTIISLNILNRRSGNQSWRVSKTKAFLFLVLAHNIFLMLYSGATFAAMVRALRHIWPSYGGYDYQLTEAVDALCKMHGPRGIGDAAFYNTTNNQWTIKNAVIHLAQDGTPDSTDVGRLWNEGLAFWGWLFYLSKFYEVVDSFILVLKGKKSSTLQIYHHAGAMAAMWAGIRYMSPPIWMFVCVNSFIHTWMYGYYTVSALGYRVPIWFKRTLTTCQIMQFVVGALFAAAHLFVSYSVPVSTPYYIFSDIASAASIATTSAPSLASSVVSSLAPTASTQLASFLKKMAFRAAGQEGLAENVGRPFGEVEESIRVEEQKVLERIQEVRYRNEYQRVPCIDTSGESFAIWLNLIYLFPLTWLFLRFFIRSYTNCLSKSTTRQQKPVTSRGRAILGASEDAAKYTGKETEKVGDRAERTMSDIGDGVKRDLAGIQRGLKSSNAKHRIEVLEERTEELSDSTMEGLRQKLGEIGPDGSIEEKVKKLEEFFSDVVTKGEEKILANGGDKMDEGRESVDEFVGREESQGKVIKDEQQEEDSISEGIKGSEKDGISGSEQIKEEDIQATSKQSDRSDPQAPVDGDDKENEEPSEPQTNGETQPGSMTTSQTVSDLDESYADVIKGDAHSPKAAQGAESSGS